MKGSSSSLSSRAARMENASSSYSCDISHLGDSGSHGTVAYRIIMKMSWNARGNRHDTGPPTKEKP